MNTIDTAADRYNESDGFHLTFDSNAKVMMEPVRDVLLESVSSCTQEEIIGQLLMNLLGDNGEGQLTARLKQRLVAIADHMGPDWTQALYHAAVFMTKVA